MLSEELPDAGRDTGSDPEIPVALEVRSVSADDSSLLLQRLSGPGQEDGVQRQSGRARLQEVFVQKRRNVELRVGAGLALAYLEGVLGILDGVIADSDSDEALIAAAREYRQDTERLMQLCVEMGNQALQAATVQKVYNLMFMAANLEPGGVVAPEQRVAEAV